MATKKEIEATQIKHIGISVSLEFHKRLGNVVRKADTTNSALMRELLIEWVIKEEKKRS